MEKLTYQAAFELVKKQMQKSLTSSPRIIKDYLGYMSDSQGKMIRAASVLICNEDSEGYISENAVKAAAAIEIIHLASLIHDDIIDDADLRRGKETLQKKFGKRTAVICGDYLLSVAFQMVSAIPDGQKYLDSSLPNYIRRLCLGELLQHINNNNLDLSALEYIKIISGKTAALFEASFFMGALLGECEKSELKKYKKIGKYTGIIFQLQDDCLDFCKTKEEVKKPVQSDYEQGVITLPLIHAFSELPEFKKNAVEDNISRVSINQAVEDAGGLEFTRSIIIRYVKKAKKEIDSLSISDEKRRKMNSILQKAAAME